MAKIRTTAPAKGSKYYTQTAFGGYNKCILGYEKLRPWKGSVLSNCVGYAYGRFMEMANKTKCSLPTCNAEDWYSATTAYKKGKTPKVGAVIVWGKGKLHNGNDGCGHVAVVEKINDDGSLFLSESDYSTDVFKNRTVKKVGSGYYLGSTFTFFGFIYNPDVAEEKPKKETEKKSTKPTVGEYEVNTDWLNIRSGAGTNYHKKTFAELTVNAQTQIRKHNHGRAIDGYVKGVKITVSEVVYNKTDKLYWGKTPSGWVALDYCTLI